MAQALRRLAPCLACEAVQGVQRACGGASAAPLTSHARHVFSRATDAASTSGRGALQHWSAAQRRHMFIQTQSTPNPSSLMFMPGKTVMEQGVKNFANAREAMASPLATAIFRIDGVQGVFFGSDFVTVQKTEGVEWHLLKPEVYAAIMDFFTSGRPLFTDAESASPSDTAINEDDSDVVAMIKELLETRIKPAVAEDGGDIAFVGFEEPTGRVTLRMQGACAGCPSSASTLKGGIEQMMRHYIPEVLEVVEAEPDESEAAGLREFNRLEQHLSP